MTGLLDRQSGLFATLILLGLKIFGESEVGASIDVQAWLILYVGLRAWISWRGQSDRGIPVLPTALLVPIVSFVVPAYLQMDLSVPIMGSAFQPAEEEVEGAFAMVLAGLAGMVGTNALIGAGRQRSKEGQTRKTVDTRAATYALAFGIGVVLVGVPYVGGGFREAVRTAATAVPLVAAIVLIDRWLLGRIGLREKALVMAWLVVSGVQGLASGWLGAVATGPLIVGLVFLRRRGRFPVGLLVPIALVFLLLQPAKMDFRREYWFGTAEGGAWEKSTYWFQSAIDYWRDSAPVVSKDDLLTSIQPVVARTSLLPFSCLIQRMTPEVVPYQGLAPYRYLVLGLIPRFVWPEKPNFDEANRFVQVAYGLTREEDLAKVSIAVGIFTEGYMAAGFVGVVFAGALLGAICTALERFLGARREDELRTAIGIALLPRFLVVESQMTQLVSGILQTVLVCWLVYEKLGLIKSVPIAPSGGGAEDGGKRAGGNRQTPSAHERMLRQKSHPGAAVAEFQSPPGEARQSWREGAGTTRT